LCVFVCVVVVVEAGAGVIVAGAFTVVLVAGVVTVVDVAGATTAALFCVVVWLVVVLESLSATATPKGAITTHSARICMVGVFIKQLGASHVPIRHARS
jgi:hypothetical protein